MSPPIARSPLSLEEILSSLPADAKVLDLGCGGGTFDYTKFSQLEIHALDESVHEKVKGFPQHVTFNQGMASAIPERDGTIDVVVANFAFEHFPDAIAALREIDRVTRDGGHVWISMPNAGSFEDQLYRNLFAGGGHLQRPTLERFLRQVYECTSLKLISYQELPAGFTFLGESEALRHLTWAVVDSLRRSVGVDARSRSGYIFVLQKFESAGPGFREHLRCCYQCGTPDASAPENASTGAVSEDWICARCGARNNYPSSLLMVHLDEVERALALQWERYPETRPEKLRELFEERTRWALQLEGEVKKERETISRLQAEYASLRAEFDARGRWAQALDSEIHEQRAYINQLQAELRSPYLWLKRLWRKFLA